MTEEHRKEEEARRIEDEKRFQEIYEQELEKQRERQRVKDELRRKEKELEELELEKTRVLARQEREKKLVESSEEDEINFMSTSGDGLDEMAVSLNNSGIFPKPIEISGKIMSRLRSSISSMTDVSEELNL